MDFKNQLTKTPYLVLFIILISVGLDSVFAEEFGQCDQVKIRPGYFPFTEPSCELFAKHPEMGWIELGGAGIFRPSHAF